MLLSDVNFGDKFLHKISSHKDDLKFIINPQFIYL
ncbi:Uncharacterised protein [Chryseobacterium taihuense]|uniref:Uncharacterized protein n=1 Tax=Chryseobacterium taihuense TaxID=1141221 RepID=A0A4U8WCX0_9FLAO|nr:Uncharacterised protein [Chryseobacterium taihuense]